MTRIAYLAVFGGLVCALAFGESRAETTTYIDGNLTGISPKTGGTLLLSDDNAMSLRTGLTTISVPYANISKAELGPVTVHSQDVPFYKVWSLHKRFTGKAATQHLMIDFRTDEGEDRTMTLELAHSTAPGVLSAIQDHTAKSDTAKESTEGWWGDQYWKTTRNAYKGIKN